MFREELAQIKIVSYTCRELLCHLYAANIRKTETQSCCICQVLNDNGGHKAVLSVCSPAEELDPLKFAKTSLMLEWLEYWHNNLDRYLNR